MKEVEIYHKLREIQRKVKHLRDLNVMGPHADPISHAVGRAYSNSYDMIDKLANSLYNEGINKEEE